MKVIFIECFLQHPFAAPSKKPIPYSVHDIKRDTHECKLLLSPTAWVGLFNIIFYNTVSKLPSLGKLIKLLPGFYTPRNVICFHVHRSAELCPGQCTLKPEILSVVLGEHYIRGKLLGKLPSNESVSFLFQLSNSNRTRSRNQKCWQQSDS